MFTWGPMCVVLGPGRQTGQLKPIMPLPTAVRLTSRSENGGGQVTSRIHWANGVCLRCAWRAEEGCVAGYEFGYAPREGARGRGRRADEAQRGGAQRKACGHQRKCVPSAGLSTRFMYAFDRCTDG